jgi:hypothetical protein
MNGRIARLLAAAALGSATMFGSTVTVALGSNPFPATSPPFVGTLNGLPTLFVCDDTHDTVYANETWQATETSLSTVVGYDTKNQAVPTVMWGGLTDPLHPTIHVATTLYEEAAWLVYQFAGSPLDNSVIQQAIWDLFNQATGGVSNQVVTNTNKATEGYWLYHAYNDGLDSSHVFSTLTPNQIADLLILTPVVGTQSGGHGAPQEFFAIAPEPATYALFGSGLILLSLATFRRRRNKTN